jgi:hypothetical protein
MANMDLIFIYGPPAVGKLTVAEELSARSGYGVFHNHLTVDLVRPLFSRDHPAFQPLLEKLRLDAIETAATEGLTGLIFTFCYLHPVDLDFVGSIVERVESHDGHVHFVQLTASPQVLEGRVVGESRLRFRKIHTVEKLKRVVAQDFWTPIPGVESMVIDNSTVSPEEAATRIQDNYGSQTDNR